MHATQADSTSGAKQMVSFSRWTCRMGGGGGRGGEEEGALSACNQLGKENGQPAYAEKLCHTQKLTTSHASAVSGSHVPSPHTIIQSIHLPVPATS